MTNNQPTRRAVILGGAAAAAAFTSSASLLLPRARAEGLAATPTMRGGANNYLPGAPVVERIGGGGFWMSGTVRRAGDGAPLKGIRIQIWAHTTEGLVAAKRYCRPGDVVVREIAGIGALRNPVTDGMKQG